MNAMTERDLVREIIENEIPGSLSLMDLEDTVDPEETKAVIRGLRKRFGDETTVYNAVMLLVKEFEYPGSRLVKVDLSEVFRNGLWWIHSKVTGRACVMPPGYQEDKVGVLVFVSKKLAEDYLKIVKKTQPIQLKRFPIRYTPVDKIGGTLQKWRSFASSIVFPCQKDDGKRAHQIIELDDLLA